ncbi:MAG: MFS transporter [Cephaloticoccus sp.]|nr:MFS transporter [Cephaloticoccus sp.]MCF7761291.1 MFS transporter [Cephaloticoccus sp.]
MTRAIRTLSKQQTRSSLAWFNWNISLRGVFETICGGTTMVFVAYALVMGVPRDAMGYFSATIGFACILQLLCLPLVSRVRRRKRFILIVAVIEPLLLVAAVLLTPVLPPTLRPVSLGLAVFLAAACLHLTRPFADDWLATTIPSGLRGRYIGQRLRVSSLAIIATTLLVGYAVDVVGQTSLFGLTMLLIVGGLFGVAAALTLTGASMPDKTESPHLRPGDLREVIRTRPFMALLAGTVLFNLPFYIAAGYYQVFNLEVLKMRPWLIACMGVGYLVVKLLFTPTIGRICDRIGPRSTLLLIGPIYAAFFLSFPFAAPDRAWPIIVAWAGVALADGVWGVAAPAALYATIPEQGVRPAYFAVYNLVTLGCFALGGILAVPLLGLLAQVHWTWGFANLGGYHLFYALMGVIMVPCSTAVLLFPGKQWPMAENNNNRQ